jgi:hypothetical protein
VYHKVAQLKDVAAFRRRLAELNLELPVDDTILTAAQGSPLAQPIAIGGFRVGNRWCIHPLEAFWSERREADLGWRSSGRAVRRPREPQSNFGDRRESRGPGRAA